MIDRLLDGAAAALEWWIEGLWLGLPARVRDSLFPRRAQVFAMLSADETTVEIVSGSADAPPAVGIRLAETGAGATIGAAGLGIADDADVTLVLPRTIALTKRLALPAAAEPALRSVLRHELDRITPFAIDELVFDHSVAERSADTLTVDVVLARHASLSAHIDALARFGVCPTSATVAADAGSLLPVNLLPRRPRLRLPFARPPLRPAVAAAAVATLLAALYLPLLRYDVLSRDHERSVAGVRKEAIAARTALADQEAELERMDYLMRRRTEYTPPIALLLDLTQQLPEHTWLARMSFTADKVLLQGESGAASELLQAVESMDRLERAEFQAPVARSDESGKEQFTIVASLARSGR